MTSYPAVPATLAAAIRQGNCVAFVGAGFSAAVVPGWANLLRELSSEAPREQAARAERLLNKEHRTSFDLEAAAQVLRGALGDEGFSRALQRRLERPERNDAIEKRLRWLRQTPFRSILTTNFDGLLEGEIPGREAYLSVLRPTGHLWSDARFWDESRPGPRVVKLHGDIAKDPPSHLVLSRRDYRERLYGNPAYTTFLRAVFATNTVLYLGFSFTDAYLNELRSEILALLEFRAADDPIAYAVVNDVSEEEAGYFAEHEGIEILTYTTGDGPERDFSGFDRWLQAIHDQTNPVHLLGELLAGKHILWVDAQPRNNEYGMQFLQEAAEWAQASPCVIDTSYSWQEGLEELRAHTYDLVITHWGHDGATTPQGETCPVAERLLLEIRGRDIRAPAIVFATAEHADENKVRALRLGALAYVFEWSALFREVERVFAPGSRMNRGVIGRRGEIQRRNAAPRAPFGLRVGLTPCKRGWLAGAITVAAPPHEISSLPDLRQKDPRGLAMEMVFRSSGAGRGV